MRWYPVYSNKFGVPLGTFFNASLVAVLASARLASAGASSGCACKSLASWPVISGAEKDVPLPVRVAVSEVAEADLMLDPGAAMSTQVPELEKDDHPSVELLAP